MPQDDVLLDAVREGRCRREGHARKRAHRWALPMGTLEPKWLRESLKSTRVPRLCTVVVINRRSPGLSGSPASLRFFAAPFRHAGRLLQLFLERFAEVLSGCAILN